jgi:hypothetical protein
MAAYDIKVLGEKLKVRGLDVAEESLKGLVEDVFGWVESSVKESATPYDDIALGILPVIKAETLKRIDSIDGQVG